MDTVNHLHGQVTMLWNRIGKLCEINRGY